MDLMVAHGKRFPLTKSKEQKWNFIKRCGEDINIRNNGKRKRGRFPSTVIPNGGVATAELPIWNPAFAGC
jgi:hypothetical protein